MKTQLTVDLKKVQWATYHWINGKGDERRIKPTAPTALGAEVSTTELAQAVPMLEYPTESMYSRALRKGILDTWKPVCRLHITANRVLTFTGDKATSIWKAYNKHIYSK